MDSSFVHQELTKANYIPTKDIACAVASSINDSTPLLIEGAPGVGKTELAKVTAQIMNVPLLRVQFYEGLTADKILYDYNYQRQLLTIETIRSSLEESLKGKDIQEAIDIAKNIDFFGKDFLIERPVLKSINGNERCVLLLDEIDKSSEEIEYTLLEFLDGYSLSIPQFGTVTCPEDMRPIVFLTSNNYRELSSALRRRCNYLYIPPKTKDETINILIAKTAITNELASSIANCIEKIKKLSLKQVPSIAEYITWAKYLKDKVLSDMLNEEDIRDSLFMIAKYPEDKQAIAKAIKFD